MKKILMTVLVMTASVPAIAQTDKCEGLFNYELQRLHYNKYYDPAMSVNKTPGSNGAEDFYCFEKSGASKLYVSFNKNDLDGTPTRYSVVMPKQGALNLKEEFHGSDVYTVSLDGPNCTIKNITSAAYSGSAAIQRFSVNSELCQNERQRLEYMKKVFEKTPDQAIETMRELSDFKVLVQKYKSSVFAYDRDIIMDIFSACLDGTYSNYFPASPFSSRLKKDVKGFKSIR